MAASRPAAAHSAALGRSLNRATTAVERARLAAGQPALPGLSTANIAGETDGGKYLTVVHCAGVDTPPPIRIDRPGTPLTASGTGPSAGLLKMLSKPNPYKTVYTCTVNIELKVTVPVAPPKKPHCELSPSGGTTGGGTGGSGGGRHTGTACTKSVTLNTGFGGMAGQVAHHRPAD